MAAEPGGRTGRPTTFRVREAIESYIDDLEYAYALRAEAEAVRRGEIKTRRLDEIAASLGLDD
ncbi:peptidylprolyl isomerase [Actinomyces dentalis]|uniref:type II toxin-antitoxin system RelB family antitoxin n=1 Tax=Actinomyces dentalis TaxID=272548 RepID=UPI0028E93C5E|nr:peptidylprolyl isomerase [Actinomyces dentalis]